MRYLLFFVLATLTACTTPTLDLLNNQTWQPTGQAGWRYAGKQLVGTVSDGAEGAMITTQGYENFDFQVEFQPDSTVNSGVFVRCQGRSIDFKSCYEFNIWDFNPNQTYRTGAVVLRAEPLAQVNSVGQWNTYRVLAKGNHLQAWVNGTMVADLTDDELMGGYIGLQASGEGEIRFRNAKLQPLQ